MHCYRMTVEFGWALTRYFVACQSRTVDRPNIPDLWLGTATPVPRSSQHSRPVANASGQRNQRRYRRHEPDKIYSQTLNQTTARVKLFGWVAGNRLSNRLHFVWLTRKMQFTMPLLNESHLSIEYTVEYTCVSRLFMPNTSIGICDCVRKISPVMLWLG